MAGNERIIEEANTLAPRLLSLNVRIPSCKVAEQPDGLASTYFLNVFLQG